MRCDANVSVMLKGSNTLGNRCEVKNMNSLRNVQRAITYEMKRQIAIIEAGGTVEQQTRSFDAVNGTTFTLRGKEDAHDYRYFPEPDMQPLELSEEAVEEVKKAMPPLPRDLYKRYTEELGLSDYDAGILTESKPTALYYEEIIKYTENYKAAANKVIGEVKTYLNRTATRIEDFPVKPEKIAALIRLTDENKVSHSVASQQIFPLMPDHPDKDPEDLARENDLLQESDDNALEAIARKAVAAYPDKAEAYRKGNKGLLGLFMGEVMKLSDRKANPKMASDILKKILEE